MTPSEATWIQSGSDLVTIKRVQYTATSIVEHNTWLFGRGIPSGYRVCMRNAICLDLGCCMQNEGPAAPPAMMRETLAITSLVPLREARRPASDAIVGSAAREKPDCVSHCNAGVVLRQQPRS